MLKIFLILTLTILPQTNFAITYFDDISGKSLIMGTDDCSATTLLNEAITTTGVNILDKPAKSVWSCFKKSQYCPEVGVRCWSNSNNGFPSVCMKNHRVVEVDKEYADKGKVKEKRIRFDALYILKESAAGSSHNSGWEMGSDGCNPEKAHTAYRNGSGPVELDSCIENFNSLVTGGLMWGDPEISKDKYCDKSKANDDSYTNNYRIRIEEMARCFKLYPHLATEYEKFRKPKTASEETSFKIKAKNE